VTDRQTDRETDHTRSVEGVLQVRDRLLVLLSVCLQRLDTSTQESNLGLVVRQLLVIAVTAFTLLHHRLVGLLQSTHTYIPLYTVCDHSTSYRRQQVPSSSQDQLMTPGLSFRR